MTCNLIEMRIFHTPFVGLLLTATICLPVMGQTLEMGRGTMLAAPSPTQATPNSGPTAPANNELAAPTPQYVASRPNQFEMGQYGQQQYGQQQYGQQQYGQQQYGQQQYGQQQYGQQQYGQQRQYAPAYPQGAYPQQPQRSNAIEQSPRSYQGNNASIFNVPYLTGHSSLAPANRSNPVPQAHQPQFGAQAYTTHPQFQFPANAPAPQAMMPNQPYAQQVMPQQYQMQQQMFGQQFPQQHPAMQHQPAMQQSVVNGYGQMVQSPQTMRAPESIHGPPMSQGRPMPAQPSYGGMLNSYVGQLLQNDGMSGTGGYGGCDTYGCGVQDCYSPARRCWFGHAGVVLMTRDKGRNVRLSYDSDDADGALLTTRDASVDYQFGSEARFGRQFACSPWAWEVGYWSILSNQNEQTVNTAGFAGMLNSHLDFGDLDLTSGALTANVNLWYNDSQIHQVTRNFQVHQVELNFLRLNDACTTPCGYGSSGCGPARWNTNWTFGVRYMKIDENFSFNTDDENAAFGDLTGEIFYSIDLQNHLIGLQFGGQSEYQITRCLSADFDLKAGLYGNRIDHRSLVLGCQTGPAIVNGGTHVGTAADVTSNKEDLSFATELRIGLRYQLGCNVSLTGGYRAFAATSVALPEDQIPLNFGDLTGVERVDSSGGLLLHGFLLGLEWRR
ncbi:MAG: hypothetical protein ACI9HK_001014 [Pirellulaceae bacterium]|jgi:hypothetical protein